MPDIPLSSCVPVGSPLIGSFGTGVSSVPGGAALSLVMAASGVLAADCVPGRGLLAAWESVGMPFEEELVGVTGSAAAPVPRGPAAVVSDGVAPVPSTPSSGTATSKLLPEQPVSAVATSPVRRDTDVARTQPVAARYIAARQVQWLRGVGVVPSQLSSQILRVELGSSRIVRNLSSPTLGQQRRSMSVVEPKLAESLGLH